MRAIVIEQYGGPENLALREIADPEPVSGQVVIEVKAFGLNHADIYFRSGVWGEVAKVTGIECVGLVRADPDGRFSTGQRVAAPMGGMGRAFNGSYAQYTRVPAANVVPLATAMSWADLAALPESYATAWTCLHRNLALTRGQILLVRGATSALGQAAVNIAVEAGAHVIATTRRAERLPTLAALGAQSPMLEAPDLAVQIRRRHPSGVDAVLDLIGSSAILDSMGATRPDGRVCMAGFLGGGGPIDSFDPLRHMPSGVHLSFFASAFTFGNPEYPLSGIPFQTVADRAEAGVYRAKPARIFRFEEIQEAHWLMESGQANGKIVVSLS
jgi:NADPH:quinone reductase-like Zn-dependent oxidoreductase